MRSHLQLLLLASLLLTGCSSATSSARGSGEPTGDIRPLDLEEATNPEDLAAVLARHPLLSAPAATSLLLIAYDSTGALRSARVYHRRASAAESREIELILRGRLAAVATPRSLGWYLFTNDETPRLVRTDPPAARPPRMLNRTHLVQVLQGLAKRPRLPDASVRVRIFIDTDGTVGTAEIVASSGHIDVDRELLNVARLARFTTAHLDDFAVCAWVEFPITLRRNQWDFESDRLAQPSVYNSSNALAGPGF